MNSKIQYIRADGDGMELIYAENSGLNYPLHNHVSVVTFLAVLAGEVLLTVGEEKFIAPSKEVIALPPYLPHSIEGEGACTMFTLCVHKAKFEGDMQKILETAQKLLHHVCVAELMSDEQIKLFLACIAEYNHSTKTPSTHSEPVEQLKCHLERYPEQPLAGTEMAERAYVSRYHLIRTFKREVGLTPHLFQLQNRIRKAQRLLRGPLTVTQVAVAAGFFDHSHFVRSFKKVVGLSPTAYRAACKTAQVLDATAAQA